MPAASQNAPMRTVFRAIGRRPCFQSLLQKHRSRLLQTNVRIIGSEFSFPWRRTALYQWVLDNIDCILIPPISAPAAQMIVKRSLHG